MKALFCLALTCVAFTALAVDKAELDKRIAKLTAKMDALQAQPDKRVSAENLRKAQGIILLDRTKAGFIFAFQGGSGLLMARDQKTGEWGPPGFLKANEASLGLQIGGQQSFVVILLMTTNAVQMAGQGTFNFGGEASGTAGDSSGGVQGSFSSSEPPVLTYTDTSGLYGGVAIKGGALSPDNDANIAYYGTYLTFKEIVLDNKDTKLKPSQAALDLVKRLNDWAK
jgi:SH3 domain-containing YSC84-like protein 1